MTLFPHRYKLVPALLLTVSMLAGCVSLAGDVTPPPNYTPPEPVVQPAAESAGQIAEQPAVVSTAFPLLSPDPMAGQPIYMEKCEPCHGPSGLGDGSKAGNLPERPPLIGNRAVALDARPSAWFQIVSDGNLEKFMPGFKASLDDRQRWDVVAYVLTLSQDAGELEAAGELYANECAECHGEDGQGAKANAPDWRSDQDRLSILSANEIGAVIASGRGEMPAFADLSDEQRLSLAVYVRNLTFAIAGAQTAGQDNGEPVSAASPEAGAPAAESGKLVIRGQIISAVGDLETANLPVTLFGFEGMTQALEMNSTSAQDGSYEFSVENKAGMAYMVTVESQGYTFNSEILHSQDALESPSDLPVTIYATTTDTSALSIDRMHVFFDFSVPSTVQVAELFIYSNSGEALVVSPNENQPALSFRLPEGAADLQFDGGAIGDRFVETEGGFGDLSAIPPGQGQHQVLFSYSLPYDKKARLNLPVPMDVDSVVVMLPEGGIHLESPQLMNAGTRDVQGMTFNLFTGAGLPGGSQLEMSLSGKVRSAADTGTNTTAGVLVGGGALGLVLIGAGVWLFRRRNDQRAEQTGDSLDGPEAEENQESLLDAILALDDLYQAGQLPEDAYQQRRAELKDRLRAISEG